MQFKSMEIFNLYNTNLGLETIAMIIITINYGQLTIFMAENNAASVVMRA